MLYDQWVNLLPVRVNKYQSVNQLDQSVNQPFYLPVVCAGCFCFDVFIVGSGQQPNIEKIFKKINNIAVIKNRAKAT